VKSKKLSAITTCVRPAGRKRVSRAFPDPPIKSGEDKNMVFLTNDVARTCRIMRDS